MIFHGRFPGEKAAALFAAKSAEAFASKGIAVELLAPRRIDRVRTSPAEVYGVKANFKVTYLPIIDLFSIPIIRVIAYPVSIFTYAISVFCAIYFTRRKYTVLYSNEAIPLLPLSRIAEHVIYEIHDFPQKMLWLYRMLFKCVTRIIATNTWKRDQLVARFGVRDDQILVEQNAVDVVLFGGLSAHEARTRLGLKLDTQYVIYTGQLYSWKGVDTLALAIEKIPNVVGVFVGGVGEDLKRFKKDWENSANIRIVGQVPYRDIPLWQAAADVLVLPNTAREEISVHYTSPMKLFEYLATQKPIVASDLPSVREVAGDDVLWFAKPDDPESFVHAIHQALDNHNEAVEKSIRGRTRAEYHSWRKRAERILQVIL